MKRIVSLAVFLAATLAAGSSLAQPYPSKPIRLILGVPAGTTTDILARLVTDQMRVRLGQPIIVESKPGANLTIAANYVIKSDPDGYTLFFSPAFIFHPVFIKNNPVDASKEFIALSLMSSAEYWMVSSAKYPMATLKEVVDWAKANPGKLNYGDVGPGFEIMMETISKRSGITHTNVHYAGGNLVVAPLLSGDVHVSISSPASFAPHVQKGTMRALFSTGRSAVVPGLPTAGDMGFADLDNIRLNFYFWAPLKTSPQIVRKVSDSIASVARQPDIVAQFRKLFGTDPIGSTPEEARRAVEKELSTWADLARSVNFKPQ